MDGKATGAGERVTLSLLLSAAALHLALLFHFAPPRLLFSRTPVLNYDYALHVYQVQRASEAFRGWGKLWSYDPFVLAGQPAGAIEDLTSKSVELFTIALGALGVDWALAFNLYILLVHLGMPLAGYASARLLGLSRRAASVALLMWVLLWYFDSFLHWCWYVGMISWSAASYLTVLLVASMYAATERRRPWMFLALGPLAALLCIVHPFAVFPAAPPLLALYVRRLRDLHWREHAMLWGAVALAASTALVWVGPALRFRHHIGDVEAFLRPTLSYLLWDWLDLLKDVLMTGQPVRTMLRTLCLGAAGVALWRWHREGDRRVLPLGVLVGFGLLAAYGGGYLWATRQTQPYRQLGPAILAAAIPAAALLSDLLRPEQLRRASAGGKIALALAALLVAPRLVRTVLHYLPGLLPGRDGSHTAEDMEAPLISLGKAGPPAPYVQVRRYLEAHHGGRGRVVVLDWVLGEYLAAFTRVPVLGGIPQRNVPHVDAHPFRHDFTLTGGTDSLADYLDLYAVGFVVTLPDFGPLDNRRDLLEPVTSFDGYRIYRTRREPSYVLRGAGRVVEQRLNGIRISGASGAELALRFHWMETLRCRPRCEVERVPVPGDRIGFIGIKNPPPELEVFNAYD